MNKNDIINRLEGLNFDKSGYWVLAGSAMVLHGIRPETHDIDMSCTKEFADELEREGYPTVVMPDGTRRITYAEDLEIFEDWIFDKVVSADGISVISLDGLLEMKRNLGREKDLRDVQMIEEFLERMVR